MRPIGTNLHEECHNIIRFTGLHDAEIGTEKVKLMTPKTCKFPVMRRIAYTKKGSLNRLQIIKQHVDIGLGLAYSIYADRPRPNCKLCFLTVRDLHA